MPLNEKKIISIILEECGSLPDRCEGYQEELVQAIGDIIAAERLHRVRGTDIQQKINDKCNATGQFLAGRQSRSDERQEEP